MPVYVYEHEKKACDIGAAFEVKQSINDPKLEKCPLCNGPVKRIITKVYTAVPTGDTDLKAQGFTKLVRKDKGVYENVTATDKESRYFHADDPDTMPDIKKKVSD